MLAVGSNTGNCLIPVRPLFHTAYYSIPGKGSLRCSRPLCLVLGAKATHQPEPHPSPNLHPPQVFLPGRNRAVNSDNLACLGGEGCVNMKKLAYTVLQRLNSHVLFHSFLSLILPPPEGNVTPRLKNIPHLWSTPVVPD